ncbi:sugar-binding transcriptional regulator [Streptococcus ruminantium]|uniref:sugar-binding transcriptional regulator n=1 Tax=Streptococcus ruminantium TaxID=1917441 RepID=UPI00280E589C|nr:sugar-binding transcriptional regulator [Streptococcus ruminantium]MDQ8773989.1 sugar-binding transcriptional regulator [Streptococcus ruminantium]
MKQEKRRQLAKIAYLYYVEGKSQAEIATETGIYRTTVSRMLTKAKSEGIVKIEIQDFDRGLYQLEKYVQNRYGLKGLELVENSTDEDLFDLENRLAQAAADMLTNLIDDEKKVGFSWGRSLSLIVDKIGHHRMKGVKFVPIAGGPSHIHARYHVNTLIYNMASKFRGECRFINATIIQENQELANGILSSKYFEELRADWKQLDVAVVGIGGGVDEKNRQWLDMLTADDFQQLSVEKAVGETCCRCFDQQGKQVVEDLQKRTIAISLEDLKEVPDTMALAYGDQKAQAILAVLRAGYIHHLVTDERTIVKVLELDQASNFQLE